MHLEEGVVDQDDLGWLPSIDPDRLVGPAGTSLREQPLPDRVVKHRLVELMRPVLDEGAPIRVTWPCIRDWHHVTLASRLTCRYQSQARRWECVKISVICTSNWSPRLGTAESILAH